MSVLGNQQIALLWITKLAAVAVLLSCAEYLAQPKLLKSGGLLSWDVSTLRYPWLVGGTFGRMLNGLLRYPNVLGLILLRAIIAGGILLGPPQMIETSWLSFL